MDLRHVWNQEAERGAAAEKERLANVARQLGQGESLAESMRSCNGYFPTMTCDLLDVGEQTGRLDEVLLRLADHYDHLLKLRRSFLTTIYWPVIQLVMGICILGLLIWILGIIMPKDGQAKGVFGLLGPHGLLIYISFILSMGVVGVLIYSSFRQGWFGTLPMRVAIRIPVLGGCLQDMALSRVAWSLSMGLEAGIDARRAMRMALSATQNLYYTEHLESVDRVIKEGGAFHDSLRQTNVFPDDFVNALEASEIAGTQTESLLRLADDYQQRAETSSKMLAATVAYGIWAMIGALFVFVIFYLFMTLYMAPINEALEMLGMLRLPM